MDYYNIIAGNFQSTIESIANSVDELAAPIGNASQLMVNALLADRKIVICGNGVDAAVAQLFSSHLLSRFEQDRPALPALALVGDSASITAIAQDSGLNDIFSRQLRALGQDGDVLMCINSSLAAPNLHRAVQAAQERNMSIVAVSNSTDTELQALLQPSDIALQITASSPARVVELHTMVIHSFCELIDHCLFGAYNQE